jgi:hypothetical protein
MRLVFSYVTKHLGCQWVSAVCGEGEHLMNSESNYGLKQQYGKDLSFSRKCAFMTIITCFSIILAIFALETFLRVGLDVYHCHEKLGWTFAPNKTALKISRKMEYDPQILRFNSHGFRDVEHKIGTDNDTIRILLLGDSIGSGLQVGMEDLFAIHTNKSLNQTFKRHASFEIINASIDGYGTGQELIMYRSTGRLYQPNVVLLSVYPYNDLVDNWAGIESMNHQFARQCGRPYFQQTSGDLTLQNDGTPVRPKWSGMYAFLNKFRLYTSFFSPTATGSGDGERFSEREVLDLARPQVIDRAWELTTTLILQFHREVSHDGSVLVILIVPNRTEAAPGRGKPPVRVLSHELEEFLKKNNILYINLLPDLSRHIDEEEQDVYFDWDPHLTETGHELVGQLIHDWIVQNCLRLGLEGQRCGLAQDPVIRF